VCRDVDARSFSGSCCACRKLVVPLLFLAFELVDSYVMGYTLSFHFFIFMFV
jgi:hypothetical protein